MDGPDEMAATADGSAAMPDPATRHEAAQRYERCHPRDSFSDLVRRSSFSKEDRRLMEDWLAAIAMSKRVPIGRKAENA